MEKSGKPFARTTVPPGKNIPVPTESRNGQDPLPLWTSWGVEEFLAPAEIRIPNCLALSLSTKLCYVGSKEYVFFF